MKFERSQSPDHVSLGVWHRAYMDSQSTIIQLKALCDVLVSICIKDSCVVLVEGTDGLSPDYSFYRQGACRGTGEKGVPLRD